MSVEEREEFKRKISNYERKYRGEKLNQLRETQRVRRRRQSEGSKMLAEEREERDSKRNRGPERLTLMSAEERAELRREKRDSQRKCGRRAEEVEWGPWECSPGQHP